MLIFTENENGEAIVKYEPKKKDSEYPDPDEIKAFVKKRKEKVPLDNRIEMEPKL